MRVKRLVPSKNIHTFAVISPGDVFRRAHGHPSELYIRCHNPKDWAVNLESGEIKTIYDFEPVELVKGAFTEEE